MDKESKSPRPPSNKYDEKSCLNCQNSASEEKIQNQFLHCLFDELFNKDKSQPKETAYFWQNYKQLDKQDIYDEEKKDNGSNLKLDASETLLSQANLKTKYLARANYIYNFLRKHGISEQTIIEKDVEAFKKECLLWWLNNRLAIRLANNKLSTSFPHNVISEWDLALARVCCSEQLPSVTRMDITFASSWKDMLNVYTTPAHVAELCAILQLARSITQLNLYDCYLKPNELYQVLKTIMVNQQQADSLNMLDIRRNYFDLKLLRFIKNEFLPACSNLRKLNFTYYEEYPPNSKETYFMEATMSAQITILTQVVDQPEEKETTTKQVPAHQNVEKAKQLIDALQQIVSQRKEVAQQMELQSLQV